MHMLMHFDWASASPHRSSAAEIFNFRLIRVHSNARNSIINKEIKNASECIVELYKHAGIFKNTREVHREARGAAECFSHFSSVLKNPQVLI